MPEIVAMRIVCLSDTHDMFTDVSVPDGEILLHAGDLSRTGSHDEILASAEWLRSFPHTHKLVVAGNHDFCLEQGDARYLLRGLTYLQDESCQVGGIRIFGSPWSPGHHSWAFQFEPGARFRFVWRHIPDSTQILVTHGPPYGILDRHTSGRHLGCKYLGERVAAIRPSVHLFGHVHESYGWEKREGTLFVNACNCSAGYKRTRPAVVLDWSDGHFQVQPQPENQLPTATIEVWEELVKRYGPPLERRCPPEPTQREVEDQDCGFWLEVLCDEGRRQVQFRPLCKEGALTHSLAGFCGRRWAFTFGTRLDCWDRLNDNPWRRYADVPHLPE